MGGVHLIPTQRLLAASWAIFSPALCLALGNRQASQVPVPLRLGCTEPESRPLTLRLALDYFIFIFSLFSSLLHWTGAFQRGSKSLRWAQPEGLHCLFYFHPQGQGPRSSKQNPAQQLAEFLSFSHFSAPGLSAPARERCLCPSLGVCVRVCNEALSGLSVTSPANKLGYVSSGFYIYI